MKSRNVENAGVKLAFREYRAPVPADPPTIVLVHGYPDDQSVWEPVAGLLAERYRVVTYDVRGAGGSDRPPDTRSYRMEHLAADLRTVADAVSPDRPVHLVGHDWGSVQVWGALTSGGMEGRAASFTSVSGPCVEHFGQWVRDRLRRPTPRHFRELAGQFARSWYLALGAVPGAPALFWRFGGTRLFRTALRMVEGVSRPDGPSRRDAVFGVRLYRANAGRFLRRGDSATTDVPVQVVAPVRDLFVSPHQSRDTGRYLDRWWRRELPAGHWGALLRRPDVLASWVAEFVDHVEGAAEAPALRAARMAGAVPAGTGRTA